MGLSTHHWGMGRYCTASCVGPHKTERVPMHVVVKVTKVERDFFVARVVKNKALNILICGTHAWGARSREAALPCPTILDLVLGELQGDERPRIFDVYLLPAFEGFPRALHESAGALAGAWPWWRSARVEK